MNPKFKNLFSKTDIGFWKFPLQRQIANLGKTRVYALLAEAVAIHGGELAVMQPLPYRLVLHLAAA